MPTQKELQLPPQLEWKYAQEPELLAWTLRARPYNTFLANLAFTVVVTVAFGIFVVIPWTTEKNSDPGVRLTTTLIFSGMAFVAWYLTQIKTNFAYRLTQSGMEYCEWRDFPQWLLTFLKWFTGIVLVLFICLAALHPAFLLGALVGPGGMALTYLALAHSKSIQQQYTEYHHGKFEWKQFTGMAIATNREVVDLKFILVERGFRPTPWHVNIFCKPREKENIARFIHPFLEPGIPILHEKIKIV